MKKWEQATFYFEVIGVNTQIKIPAGNCWIKTKDGSITFENPYKVKQKKIKRDITGLPYSRLISSRKGSEVLVVKGVINYVQ